MKEILRRIESNRIVVIFAIFIITAFATFALVRNGFFTMYDDMQVARVWQMDKCFRDFQIPCRWVPDLGLGYGYPLYIYYAPLPYYIMEVIHLIGFSFIASVKTGFILSVLLSAIFFYCFSKNFFNKWVSIVTTSLYIFVPYRASSIYVRGSMGEAWGMAIVAILFSSFENFYKHRNTKSGIIFSLAVFSFFISHNITIVMFLPIFTVWISLRLIFGRSQIKMIRNAILFFLLGLGLSSFFILPLIFERNLVHIETLTSGYFGYLQHFLNLKQIFISLNWGYGPSILGPSDDALLGIGVIHSIVAILGFMSIYIMHKKQKINLILGTFLFTSFLAASFLTHEKSTFVWKAFKLDIFQFPWRFAMISVFSASFLAGFILKGLQKPKQVYIGLLIIITTLTLYLPFFKPKDWFYINDRQKLSGVNLKKQLTASIYDYLPNTTKRAPDNVSTENLEVIYGDVNVSKIKRGSNWFTYEVGVNSENAYVAIPTYTYPNWIVMVDNHKVDTTGYGDYGLVSFNIPSGEHFIAANLLNSFVRRVGDFFSLVSLGIVIIIAAYEKLNKKDISL